MRTFWTGLLASALIAPGIGAAPMFSTDDDQASAGAVEWAARQSASAGSRPLNVDGLSDASTGNKNLDMLLELQGTTAQSASQRTVVTSAAAASAAAKALAELRAKAGARPTSDEPGTDRSLRQPLDDIAKLEREGHQGQPVERRQWIGTPATAGGGGLGGIGAAALGGVGGSRDTAAPQDPYDDDNLLLHLPRDVVVFVRDHRYWLLGGLVALALLGVVLKSYVRRA